MTKEQTKKLSYRALITLVGAIASAVLIKSVPEFEGTEMQAYQDIAGVWTICSGNTDNVKLGQVETREGCERRLANDLVAHAKPVLDCVPTLKETGRDYQRAAAVSLAYNIGANAYCRSTSAAKFRARDWRGGCDAMLLFDKVNGRIIGGLMRRRKAERAICLTGLDQSNG